MRSWTRETRLLVVTIVLSVSVLLALARLRFPGHEPPERLRLPPRPLQQLADRAAFDDLGAAVARVTAQVGPALRVLALDGQDAASVGLDDLLAARPSRPRALALHVGGGRFVALTDRAPSSDAVPGGVTVTARDTLRGVLVVAADASAPVLSTSRPSLPAYLVVAEPTAGGIAMRPMFGPSRDTIRDARWQDPVLPLGAGAVPRGALVFSLEGAFVGGVTDGLDGPVLVPAEAIVAAAQRTGHVAPLSIGIRVQRLDGGLRTALGVGSRAGVAVSFVDPTGPAAGRLRPGDVVQSIDGTAVESPEDVLLHAAAASDGGSLALGILRQGAAMHLTVDARRRGEPASVGSRTTTPPPAGVGAVLAASRRGARVVRVVGDSPAAVAGLRAGDEIWWVQGATTSGPAALANAWRSVPTGGRLAIGIDRDGPVLLTIAKP